MAGYVLTPIAHGVTESIRLIIPWSNGGYTIITEPGNVYYTANTTTAASLVVALGFQVSLACVFGTHEATIVSPRAVYICRRDTGDVFDYTATTTPTFVLNATYAKGGAILGQPISLTYRPGVGDVYVGTTAGEFCRANTNPYTAHAGSSGNIAASALGYYSAGGCFTDASNIRFGCGLSVVIPSNDLTTFTDHAAPIADPDANNPGVHYIAGLARGATHDVMGFVDYFGNNVTKLYQKVFAAGAWTLAHSLPAGSEGAEPEFHFNATSGNILMWVPSPIGGFAGYAYSTDDGVTYTNATIHANVDWIGAMADDGAGTYWALVSNSVTGNIEVWSSAAIGSGWSMTASIATSHSFAKAGVIDLANTVMFVWVNGAVWSASSPYTSWSNVGSTTASAVPVAAFFRANTSGNLVFVPLEGTTVEESNNSGVNWTNRTFTGMNTNEVFKRGYPDARSGASQKAFAVTNEGRFVTGPVTGAAWSSSPAGCTGSGLLMAVMAGAASDTSVFAHVLGCVPFDLTNTAADKVQLQSASNVEVFLSENGTLSTGIKLTLNLNGNFAATRLALCAQCIRPSGGSALGALVADGYRMLTFTDSDLTTYATWTFTADPGNEGALMVASNNGVYLVETDSSIIYASLDGVSWDVLINPATIYELAVGNTQP